jgi:hypothetical protein
MLISTPTSSKQNPSFQLSNPTLCASFFSYTPRPSHCSLSNHSRPVSSSWLLICPSFICSTSLLLPVAMFPLNLNTHTYSTCGTNHTAAHSALLFFQTSLDHSHSSPPHVAAVCPQSSLVLRAGL